MRALRRTFLLLLLIAIIAVALFFFFRRDTQAAYGKAVALCPGPDLYGYTCASGAGFTYIDATNDTFLYADDGVIELALPFPFVFYGATYTAVTAGSNGTLQFGGGMAQHTNRCLDEGPAPGMGDLIAPFWDDLDLRFSGYLETEVTGEAPQRIFVVEWDDVPRFGDDQDRVTFQVQLFEESNNILVLYQDVTLFEGHNGGSATIGLQSEAQGLALQYSCNQPTVADATRLLFAHPDPANADVGQEVAQAPVVPGTTAVYTPTVYTTAVKGDMATLLDRLNARGPAALAQMRAHWLSQRPSRQAAWEWADFTGSGRDDLLLLWRGAAAHPELTRLALLAAAEDGALALALDHTFSTRETAVSRVDLLHVADLTGDGAADAVLRAGTHDVWVLTAAGGRPALHPLPQTCRGSLALVDMDGNGRLHIVRDGCDRPGRVGVGWNGREFEIVSP